MDSISSGGGHLTVVSTDNSVRVYDENAETYEDLGQIDAKEVIVSSDGSNVFAIKEDGFLYKY